MIDAAALQRQLETHLRVATFPLGIRSLAPGEPIPEKAKRPAKHLGAKMAICQSLSIARRYGWTMAFDGSDLACPIAKAAFGFESRNAFYTEGGLAAGMYAACGEAAARFEGALAKYEPGEISAVVAGPLARISFEPDTVLVYGNSAQVTRLVNACLFAQGGSLKSDFSGRGDCTDICIKGRQTGEPQVILPCYGDRIFGMAGDDEMAFTFPWSKREEVVKGLEGTHAGGIRYPVPVYARYQPEFPNSYQQLEKLWQAEKDARSGKDVDDHRAMSAQGGEEKDR